MLPDQRLFNEDVGSAEFRAGLLKGKWGLAEDGQAGAASTWPQVHLWMAAAPRANAPDRFHVELDASGYRSMPPTGTFWDQATKAPLGVDKRPKGRTGSRVARIFRTDWENGRAFYHPYDRLAAQSHLNWKSEQPRRVWSPAHTIVDWLELFHGLLQSEDYIGV